MRDEGLRVNHAVSEANLSARGLVVDWKNEISRRFAARNDLLLDPLETLTVHVILQDHTGRNRVQAPARFSPASRAA